LPSRGPDTIDVSVEVGAKRAFACALAWPGWCRGGRDESSALEALLAYGPRYAHVLRGTRLGFRVPADARVVERLEGDATTDFGAPGAAPSADAAPMTEADLRRARSLLRAGWEAFDRAVEAAAGRTLATGPRGGGRDLDRIVAHVLDAEGGYLARIGTKLGGSDADATDMLDQARAVVLDSLATVVRDGVPPSPRGGKRWTPRYFLRRSAWHVLDHAWELEDRTPS
jgi:hypothetical protein